MKSVIKHYSQVALTKINSLDFLFQLCSKQFSYWSYKKQSLKLYPPFLQQNTGRQDFMIQTINAKNEKNHPVSFWEFNSVTVALMQIHLKTYDKHIYICQLDKTVHIIEHNQ